MDILNIIEINKSLNDKRLHLPLDFDSEDIIKEFNEFIALYETLIAFRLSYELQDKIKVITKTVKSCLIKYFNGQPKEAYVEFENSLDNILKTTYYYQNKLPFNEVENLYRIRTLKDSENHKNFTVEDIFHVPFKLRGIVSSSRYSISGYPCLYLATSLKVSILETNPDFSNAICSRFSFCKLENLRILNLSKKLNEFRIIENNDESKLFNFDDLNKDISKGKDKNIDYYRFDDYRFQDYLVIYPLIAACSIKVNNKNKNFKQEYIIPQLLLQWIRNQMNASNIIGIKYFTTRAKDPIIIGYNYVFPTNYQMNYYLNNENYCKALSSIVQITNPIKITNLKDVTIFENELLGMKTFNLSSL